MISKPVSHAVFLSKSTREMAKVVAQEPVDKQKVQKKRRVMTSDNKFRARSRHNYRTQSREKKASIPDFKCLSN